MFQLEIANQSSSINERLSMINGRLGFEYTDEAPPEKADLDLQLKLHYLENSTRRGVTRMLDGSKMFPSSEAQSAIYLQQIDELSIQLEQRNQLLVRAKTSIEALKTEVIKVRSESFTATRDFEDQLKESRHDYETMMGRYHTDVLCFESRISAAEDVITNKEILRFQAEKKLVSAYDKFQQKKTEERNMFNLH